MSSAVPLIAYRPKTRLEVRHTRVERPRFPVIDVHNHVYFEGQWSSAEPGPLLETMDEAGVRVFTCVDAAGPDDPVTVVRETVRRFRGPHPDRFLVFARPDWRLLAESEADPAARDRRPAAGGDETVRIGQALARRFTECVAEGARGLKLWKDLGLTLRDRTGDLVRVNDPRLDPLLAKAGELGLPVLVHAADPVAFFDPLDTGNERYEELVAHPDWHFHGPRFPPFRRIIEDFRDLVRRHPRTTFIGAHVGGYAENLGYVGGMLRECPNYYVDIGARAAELGRQPYSARRFFLDFADRILFGLDYFPPTADAYRVVYRFLETEDEYFDYTPDGLEPQGRWKIYGLGLPDEVLAKVYYENACRVIPGVIVAE